MHRQNRSEGLMKPQLVSYDQGCGVSIHLRETPGETEDTKVSSVQIQVLDIKAINQFVEKSPKR
jgi:hypothetical protein